MIRHISTIAIFLATPVLAQDADDVAAMTTAIQDAGCIVTPENGDAVLAASGLSEQQTMDVIAALYTAGQVSLDEEGNMKLTNEVCP